MNWDDLRFFLAVARHRTLSDAARALGVSHTTVARRLEQLQESAQAELLVRTPDGWVLTEFGDSLRVAAERAEVELDAARRVLMGTPAVRGRLTVTAVDVLVELYSQVFETFIAQRPEIELCVLLDNQRFDLSRRHADVALRYSNNPPAGLVGRRLARHPCAPFAAPGLVERVGADASFADYPWILWTPDQHAKLTEAWHDHHVGRPPVARVNHSMALGQLVRVGVGAAILTESVGRLWGLHQIGPRIPDFDIELWILTHPDLRNSARTRAFIDHFASGILAAEEARMG